MYEELLGAVKFDDKGLLCAIAQDRNSGRVLMVAWMNAEALQKRWKPVLPIITAVRGRSSG
ncbi:phosphoribosyl-AMP cyclohydrolase [Neisseria elongata subsp. glycolytica ATCC 29315]|uniref:Phosphoribosyl-AMP cyclohydrolase n=1 Tax=Neisseria elongata subsp. glycolytica ATCC 29315 TaxID=546263 RepID=D4DT75_NEIEG|nr:phosphoribosyl-AMP cyclohydrolase [Neisseria elongata subsp. glycolytica ATCC 29315]